MSEDEEVDVRMRLDILLGEQHQMLAVLPQVYRLVRLLMFDVAVLCPSQSESDAPSGMQIRERPLA